MRVFQSTPRRFCRFFFFFLFPLCLVLSCIDLLSHSHSLERNTPNCEIDFSVTTKISTVFLCAVVCRFVLSCHSLSLCSLCALHFITLRKHWSCARNAHDHHLLSVIIVYYLYIHCRAAAVRKMNETKSTRKKKTKKCEKTEQQQQRHQSNAHTKLVDIRNYLAQIYLGLCACVRV